MMVDECFLESWRDDAVCYSLKYFLVHFCCHDCCVCVLKHSWLSWGVYPEDCMTVRSARCPSHLKPWLPPPLPRLHQPSSPTSLSATCISLDSAYPVSANHHLFAPSLSLLDSDDTLQEWFYFTVLRIKEIHWGSITVLHALWMSEQWASIFNCTHIHKEQHSWKLSKGPATPALMIELVNRFNQFEHSSHKKVYLLSQRISQKMKCLQG